eukprot:1123345-Rhodomonas_salina.1
MGITIEQRVSLARIQIPQPATAHMLSAFQLDGDLHMLFASYRGGSRQRGTSRAQKLICGGTSVQTFAV